MLNKGYISSSSVYVSYAHNKKICDVYLKECRKTFKKISVLLKNNKIKESLKIPVRTDAFQRL